jgi:uncharacterized protein YcfL
MAARQAGTVGRDSRANPANAIRIRVPQLLASFVAVCLLCLGCASVETAPAAADWYQLDDFAERHLLVGLLKTGHLDDGTEIAQFEVTNKTDEPVAYQYKWLWMDENGISAHHARRRWKTSYLEPGEVQLIQSRSPALNAIRSFVRIGSLSNRNDETIPGATID